MIQHTGIDFSKILGGQTKILGAKDGKSDKCMGYAYDTASKPGDI